MTTIVEARDLRKQYDPPTGIVAVEEVSFTIERGEIFSLLGPNGAGKTTTISMLSSLILPTGGDAFVAGHSVTSAARQVKEVIGVVPQEIALYPTISARENLSFWGRMYGLSGRQLTDRIAETLAIAGLAERAGDKVETFSGGMKRRLNIAVGLLHAPQVLYMDEPTVGIDPQSRRRILDTIQQLNEGGLTVLYTTHYMEEAEELSDRVGIIDHGRLVALGTQDELTSMIGRYDTLALQLESAEDQGDLAGQLAGLTGVHQAAPENGAIMVQTRDANALLPAIVSWASERAIRFRGIEIQEPNLEAVFLHLTGRALRD